MADGSPAPLSARLMVLAGVVLGYLAGRHLRIAFGYDTPLAAALFPATGTVLGFLLGLRLARWIIRGDKGRKE